MTAHQPGQAVPDQGAASPRAQVFHVELGISTAFEDHEAFVILDALQEYASTQRWRAEDGDNAEFLTALADTADRLHTRIDAQMGDANIRDVNG